jgi:hypothetical protein
MDVSRKSLDIRSGLDKLGNTDECWLIWLVSKTAVRLESAGGGLAER